MKNKTYIHKDLTAETFDNFRKALGSFARIETVASPLKALTSSPREEYFQYVDSDAFTINDFVFTDERGLGTRYATINHSADNKYKIFNKFMTNPAKIVPIDDKKLLPNFRIPFRITINEQLTRGDKYWYTVFMGGKVNNVSFPKLVELDKVFYDLYFNYAGYEPYYLYKNYDTSDSSYENLKTYKITCKYPDYNKFVDNFQQWASDKHELLLPNMIFESQVRRDLGDVDLFKDSSFVTEEEISRITAAARSPEHANRLIIENFRDETINYNDLLNYYFPRNYPETDASTELTDRVYSGAKLFPEATHTETLDIFTEDHRLSTLLKDEYFGDRWIYNWQPDTELLNKVINAQKNIFLTSDFSAYTARELRQRHEIDENRTDGPLFLRKQQTSNINYVYIEFDRDYDAYGAELIPGVGYEYTGASTRELTTAKDNARFTFRDIIDRADLSTKFLETIKDIEEGNIQDLSFVKHQFKSNTSIQQPTSPTEFGEDYYIDDIKLHTLDYFKLLTYIYNNYDAAINNNYTTIGPMLSTQRPTRPTGPRYGEPRTTADGNLLYRYSNSQNTIKAISNSIDAIRTHFFDLSPESLDASVWPDEGLETSSVPELDNLIFQKIIDLDDKFVDVLAYKIEKSGGDATGDSRTQNHIQNFWIWNRAKTSAYNPELSCILADSQVRYGHTYTYTAFAYLTVLGTKYKYSDFRLTKMTNAYDLELSERGFEIDGEIDLYCVQFYDPTDMVIKPQNLTISSVGERNPEGYEYSNLAEYNTFATSEFDILDTPQAADFHFNFEPCLKIVKVPIFQKTVTVYDNPGNKISVEPFHVINNENKIGFNVSQDNFRDSKYPAVITTNDKMVKEKYLHTKDLKDTELIENFSESPARYLEVYRIKTKPTSYSSFSNALVSKIDLRMQNTHYNRTDFTLSDQIKSNTKYYYLFRFVTENNMPGHVSRIYEATLVDDGGYKYAKFDTLDTSEFIVNNFETTSKPFKKILQLEPHISQVMLDTSEVDFTKRATDQINNVKIGKAESSIFDKKFKIRLTSKKTGKKTDLNVTFNIREKDLS